MFLCTHIFTCIFYLKDNYYILNAIRVFVESLDKWERLTVADALEPVFAAQWRSASDDGVRLRAVIDQVASLTDVSASAWHARWCGMLSSQL